MTPLTYETLREHPEFLDLLVRRAHRERAEALERLIVAPLKAAFRRLFTRRAASVRASLQHPALKLR